MPSRIVVPPVERPATGARLPIAGYVLALSWSPEFCRDFPGDEQCARANGRFGFIVHGLWPQGQGGRRPEWCPAPPVSVDVARAQFCATPSVRLIAREWAKHGSCAAANAADYFAATRRLYGAIRWPDMDALSRRPLDVGAFKRAMSARNPDIQPSHLAIVNERDGGWLREIRLCLGPGLRSQPCPRGSGGGAPDGAVLRIWRGSR